MSTPDRSLGCATTYSRGELLTVGADGRGSRIRAAARQPLVETSRPMDVLWFRLNRRAEDADVLGLRLSPGQFVALIKRGTWRR